MGAKVTVTVSGPVGSGKSAILGEIEIALKAIGVPVSYADEKAAQSEKNMTHADWASALELYQPSVVLVEKIDPPAAANASREIDRDTANKIQLDHLRSKDRPILVWCVYENPSDHPGKWVARPFLGDEPTNVVLVADSYEEIRAKRPIGLCFTFGRSPTDDPCIRESWI